MMLRDELDKIILVRLLIVNKKIKFKVYSIVGDYLILFLCRVVS